MATSSVYPVQLSVDYPERSLNRLTTFFRSFTVIPIGTTYPNAGDFVVGVLRWSPRVRAYAVLMVTDEYPPFQLSE